jgi:hypothetical protein
MRPLLNGGTLGGARGEIMSGCVLRVDGSDDVDIEAVVAGFPLKPLTVFRKGALPRPTAKRVSTSNGFNIEVSNTRWNASG